MAKLSADNVVLMLRLRKTEERCKILESEAAELRAAVDSQSGAWFEDIRATVQQRLEEGMQEARQLQARLDESVKEHERKAERLEEANQKLGAHLTAVLSSCEQLEQDLQQSQCAFHALLSLGVYLFPRGERF
jgi:chromosome segregation ATPase